MTLFDYLLPIFYKPVWTALKLMNRLDTIVFYAADPLDYEMFLPIKKHLDFKVVFVSKNAKTSAYFAAHEIPFKKYPVFPRAVIMGRHAAYKFPSAEIIKIGFDHGLYQFKRWTKSKYYNLFDVYFVSSPDQVNTAQARGIHTVKAIGYPKLDKAFDGSITSRELDELRKELRLDSQKPTVIFTSTWDVAGLSALHKWVDRVGELTQQYNVLLTAHPWTKKEWLEKLKRVPGAIYLPHADVTKYLMIADVFVGDYNSLIGEFCALDKPLVTFKTPPSSRSIPEVRELISAISEQVETFEELPNAIEKCLTAPHARKDARQAANKKLFLALDGKAGQRAAKIMKDKLQPLLQEE